ncbi:MAG: sulfotransferase [Pirellulales bacterium]
MKWIHIVGCPRSGTTLALELFTNCFAIDDYVAYETSIFPVLRKKLAPDAIHCSKNPQDVLVATALLRLEKNLHFVYLERDPRDVIVSKHRQSPDCYWANLGLWRRYQQAAERNRDHPRFVIVRYEDMVERPNETQRALLQRMPFLKPTTDFNNFHGRAKPSRQSNVALNGLRPISTGSLGAWQRHKPRLVAQMQRFGSLKKDLIHLGYEPDTSWTDQLAGVEPNNHQSFWPENVSPGRILLKAAKRWKGVAAFALHQTRSRRKIRRDSTTPESLNPAEPGQQDLRPVRQSYIDHHISSRD